MISFLRIPESTSRNTVEYIKKKYSSHKGTTIIYGKKKYEVYQSFLGNSINKKIQLNDPIRESIVKIQRFYLRILKNRSFSNIDRKNNTIKLMKNKIMYQNNIIKNLKYRLKELETNLINLSSNMNT